MKHRTLTHFCTFLVAGWLLSSAMTGAQERSQTAPPPPVLENDDKPDDDIGVVADEAWDVEESFGSLDGDLNVASGNGLPPEFQDSAFERHVDLALVGTTILARDVSLLTDLALQLAEGERVLLRQHKSGVTARGLLERAGRLAVDKQDKETLARLAKAADKLQDEELAAQLASLEKLDGASRTTDPALTISLDSANLDAAIRIKYLLDAIKEAELIGDSNLLDEIESEVTADVEISDAQKEAVSKRVKTARDEMSEEAPVEADPIAKLSAASRQHWITRPQDWGKTGIHIFPRREESVSEITVFTPPSIDRDGGVWSGSSRGGGRGQYVGKADLQYTSQGLAYWVSNYGNLSPVRAPQHDRVQQREPIFRIIDSGHVFENNTYLGEARRVRFKSGNTGWSFQIPNGWYIYRYDGETRTRKRA